MAEPFTFVCLDPRKKKRAWIEGILGPLGTMNWLRLPAISRKDWPETTERAEIALNASRSIPVQEWKRKSWSRILQMQYNGTRRYFENHRDHVAVAWNGLNGSRRVFMDAAKDAGARTLFFELGPFPGRITVDPQGVNYANMLPREAEPFLDWLTTVDTDSTEWHVIGRQIEQRLPDEPPAPTADLPPLTDPFAFVPLQVPGDSQLRLFGGAFKTVKDFVQALIVAAEHLPAGWHLRVKEHPSTPAFVKEILNETKAPIYLDNVSDTFAQVTASRGVVTVNSSVGLEAMFFDKPVVACGDCFWAIPGMAMQAKSLETLSETIAQAETWSFDPIVRNAVMTYLSQVYYLTRDDKDPLEGTHSTAVLVSDLLLGRNPLQSAPEAWRQA